MSFHLIPYYFSLVMIHLTVSLLGAIAANVRPSTIQTTGVIKDLPLMLMMTNVWRT
jgi:hypothetical protein